MRSLNEIKAKTNASKENTHQYKMMDIRWPPLIDFRILHPPLDRSTIQLLNY